MMLRLPPFPTRLRHAACCIACAGLLTLLGLTPVAAFSVVPPTFDELVSESGRIVRAQVAGVEAFETTTATGHNIIKTRVTWTVEGVMKGSAASTLTLEFFGGRIGDRILTVSGMPTFQVGDRDYLFIEANERVICPLVAAGHGRYPIVVDAESGRTEVRRSNGVALRRTGQVAQSLDAGEAALAAEWGMTPEEFESAIRASLASTPSITE